MKCPVRVTFFPLIQQSCISFMPESAMAVTSDAFTKAWDKAKGVYFDSIFFFNSLLLFPLFSPGQLRRSIAVKVVRNFEFMMRSSLLQMLPG